MEIGERQLAVTPRFDGVDVLRGFSILSVVLLHTWIRMHFPGSPVNQVMRGRLAYLLLRNGDNGVTVFFAVSGFLITLTSLRRFGRWRECAEHCFIEFDLRVSRRCCCFCSLR